MHWTAFARDTGRNRWYRCPSEFDGAMRRLGGPFLDVAQVKKLMLRHDGCVALKANTWRESTFTVLQSLPLSSGEHTAFLKQWNWFTCCAVSIRYRFDHRSILSGSIFDEYRK